MSHIARSARLSALAAALVAVAAGSAMPSVSAREPGGSARDGDGIGSVTVSILGDADDECILAGEVAETNDSETVYLPPGLYASELYNQYTLTEQTPEAHSTTVTTNVTASDRRKGRGMRGTSHLKGAIEIGISATDRWVCTDTRVRSRFYMHADVRTRGAGTVKIRVENAGDQGEFHLSSKLGPNVSFGLGTGRDLPPVVKLEYEVDQRFKVFELFGFGECFIRGSDIDYNPAVRQWTGDCDANMDIRARFIPTK